MLISDEELFKTNKGSKIKFTDLTKNNALSNQDLINQSNQFVPNAPFFYCLKPSENRKVFCCFQGVEKGCIGKKWVKGGMEDPLSITVSSNHYKPCELSSIMNNWKKNLTFSYWSISSLSFHTEELTTLISEYNLTFDVFRVSETK